MMRRGTGTTTLERSAETRNTPRLRNTRRRRTDRSVESPAVPAGQRLVAGLEAAPVMPVDEPQGGTVRAVRGVDLGPWDVGEVEDERETGLPESATGFTNSDGSKRLSLVCCDIDIPVGFAHWVGLDSVVDGIPDSVHFRRSAAAVGQKGTTISVRVLAAPKSGDRWSAICQQVYDLTCAMTEKTTAGKARRRQGLYGSEVHVYNATSRQQAVIGVDGPRWTAIATVYGSHVTDSDLRATYLMLSTMVVYRSFEPKLPDEPLSVQIVRPEA